MKKILLITFLLISSNCFAEWIYTGQTQEVAGNYNQYLKLKEKYPNMLGDVSRQEFGSAYVGSDNFLWSGTTLCSPDDLRLKKAAYNVVICKKNTDTCLSSWWDVLLPDTDPCSQTN